MGRGFEADVIEELRALMSCYAQIGEFEKVASCAERTLLLCANMGDLDAFAQAIIQVESIYRQQGQSRVEEMLGSFERILPLLEKATETFYVRALLNIMGNTYLYWGKLEKALNCFERALMLNEQAGDVAEIATSLNNIGEIHRMSRRVEEAQVYYERALALFEQEGRSPSIAPVLNNIGNLFYSQGVFGNEATKHCF
jgi:tetratricopeptide (TPR) repeat protein